MTRSPDAPRQIEDLNLRLDQLKRLISDSRCASQDQLEDAVDAFLCHERDVLQQESAPKTVEDLVRSRPR